MSPTAINTKLKSIIINSDQKLNIKLNEKSTTVCITIRLIKYFDWYFSQ